MVEVGVGTVLERTVADGISEDTVVNMASLSAGVRPLRAMEKRS